MTRKVRDVWLFFGIFFLFWIFLMSAVTCIRIG